MCYDVASLLNSKIKYAKHRQANPEYIADLEKKLDEMLRGREPKYHANGFTHPDLLVFTNDKPLEPQCFMWGLLPSWVKDKQKAKETIDHTLNARSETIFEKPSFKESAISKRCLIYVDGFYEHHHLKGKTFPFHIAMKDESPIALAGLWNDWTDCTTGEIMNTVTIVTTTANKIMEKIHNNPKAKDPRMPVILPKEKQEEWLIPIKNEEDKKKIEKLMVPFPENLLTYYSVPKLRGEEAIGNSPKAREEYNYPELKNLFSNSTPTLFD